MADDVQATEKTLEPSRRSNPKTPQATLLKCKADYEAGDWVSLKELGERYGIDQRTLQSRITREGWAKQRAVILGKAQARIEENAVKQVDRVSDYLSNTFLRARKYEQLLDKSIAQNDEVISPEHLDAYSRSEMRIHELAKSALRLPAVQAVDITSQGKSIGASIIEAIEKLRESGKASDIKISDAAIDRVIEAEIVP